MKNIGRHEKEWFEEFYYTRIEEAVQDIGIYGDVEKLLKGLRQFPEWVGNLVCVHWLLYEFQNGGLMQFFINSTGILAPETIVSLRRMDLPDVAEALNSAVGAFGAQYPRAKEDRYQILRRLAGLRFEDTERMIWRAGLFKDVEDRVSKVGTGTICVKMNEYAKRHADESAP